MSTLTVSNISNGSVSTSSTNVIQGSAKAWVNFNGVSGTSIRASYNVSSVTRNATGDYTVNFTNAFTDINYTPVISTSPAYGVSTTMCSLNLNPSGFAESAPTTTAFRFININGGGTYYDAKYASVAVFR